MEEDLSSFRPPLPFFDNIFLPQQITVKDVIVALLEIENGGALEEEWEFENTSPYDLLMQRHISFDEYY